MWTTFSGGRFGVPRRLPSSSCWQPAYVQPAHGRTLSFPIDSFQEGPTTFSEGVVCCSCVWDRGLVWPRLCRSSTPFLCAKKLMVAIPREHWLPAAKKLAGDPGNWSQGYEQVLRAGLADRIMEGPSCVRQPTQIITHGEYEADVVRALKSVLERMKSHEKN